MSTYILMKILESVPDRYDTGIRLLTLGTLNRTYDQLESYIKEGQKVLDIGCGTGALTLRAARLGAGVRGIDVNPRMLEIAAKRAVEQNLRDVELDEMGVAELGSEKPASYDVVMSGLCFSELSEDEQIYALKEVKRILKPGGLLILFDEVKPVNLSKRIFNWLIRLPLVLITLLIAQTTTRAVINLPGKVKEAGLDIELLRLNRLGNFIELVGRKR